MFYEEIMQAFTLKKFLSANVSYQYDCHYYSMTFYII